MKKALTHIGTSGWHYGHWIGPFYPEHTPKQRLFEYYSTVFSTVEINNTFYRLPEEKTFKAWHGKSPPGFVFAVKASRLITHVKRLKDPEGPLENLLSRASSLGDRLGPVLFQLPPRWRVNLERLSTFLDALPEGFSYAFEFRDPDWFRDEVYGLLRGRNAAFCVYEYGEIISPRVITADFAYIRLHGPSGRYRGSYTAAALKDWAGFIKGLKDAGRGVYCYFDNDEAGYAAMDAMRLEALVNGRGRGAVKPKAA